MTCLYGKLVYRLVTYIVFLQLPKMSYNFAVLCMFLLKAFHHRGGDNAELDCGQFVQYALRQQIRAT